MSSVKVFVAKEFDPWLNLATENWIFNAMNPQHNILFLWRNSPTVVIGRYQNPWQECDLEAMEKDGVKLARRQRGGGAVFHDLGNTNFTFMSSRTTYSKERNNQIIISALKEFGIHAETSGRNDLVVDGKKFSGSAFKLAQDRAFHHGTILISADLKRLGSYLTPDKEKLNAKGVKSVKSRVTNLIDYSSGLTHENLCTAIVEEFFNAYGQRCELTELTHKIIGDIPDLKAYYEQMADWEWRFGRTPQFEYETAKRFPWGRLSLHFTTKGGRIVHTAVYSDALMPELIEDLTNSLTHIRFTKEDIIRAMAKTAAHHPDYSEQVGQAREFLLESLVFF
ncbi:MAG: lipoate--protein ligase [Spirochaetales bacterium]|jgi:lipoate-protein ligase A|nr:lipoate--protein ligase [Spirochaetales bacterium]